MLSRCLSQGHFVNKALSSHNQVSVLNLLLGPLRVSDGRTMTK